MRVKLTNYFASEHSITVDYELQGPADGVCVILDYDSMEGFYSYAPTNTNRRQVRCSANRIDTYEFTGLQSNTRYWFSMYPYLETSEGARTAGSGGGIGSKEIQTNAKGTFIAVATEITSNSVTLSTTRINKAGEYYSASCDSYDGTEQTGFTLHQEISVVGLKPDTQYTCRMYIYPSSTGGQTQGMSEEFSFKTNKETAETFSAIVKEVSKNSVTLFTSRAPKTGEYYDASCSPYTGKEDSGGFTKNTTIRVNHLKPDTQYICRINILPSATGGLVKGSSDELIFRTLMEAPPAEYEDEVISNYETYFNPFPDTNTDELEGKAAAELYRRAVIGGFPDGEFKGTRNVNRAEAAKFLLLAKGTQIQELKNNGKFRDVKEGEWYVKYIITAAKKGILSGYPDGSFKPADTVNTAEFLKMLALTFSLQKDLSYSYADVKSEDWFAPYAGIAKKYNLFPKRTAFKLLPGKSLSRNEVAVAIYQYLSNR